MRNKKHTNKKQTALTAHSRPIIDPVSTHGRHCADLVSSQCRHRPRQGRPGSDTELYLGERFAPHGLGPGPWGASLAGQARCAPCQFRCVCEPPFARVCVRQFFLGLGVVGHGRAWSAIAQGWPWSAMASLYPRCPPRGPKIEIAKNDILMVLGLPK